MSCDEGNAVESKESASSQLSKVSDCRPSESCEPPVGDDNHVKHLERTPLNDISSSNATDDGSQAKGKRRASDVQGSMASGRGSGSSDNKSRKRLNFEEKLEVLELLGAGTTRAEVARRYACSPLTVWKIAKKEGELQRKKESPGFNGKAKAEMPVWFPKVDNKVKSMVEDARRHGVSVTRHVITSFGRAVKKDILSSGEISQAERKRLDDFCASEAWARGFIKRQGPVSKAPHGEAGGVDREAAKEGMDMIRETASRCALEKIFNVDKTSREVGSDNEKVEIKLKSKSSEEISQVLDSLDEHAVSVGNSKVQNLLRQVREGLIPGSVEERIVQPDDTEIAETVD